MSNDINSSKNYCVYKHTNLINNKIYIGITSRDPKKRWASGYGYMYNEHFWRAIKKYGWNTGFVHEVLFTGLTFEEACNKEIELIAFYQSNNPSCGYNKDKGGRCMQEHTKYRLRITNKRKKKILRYDLNGHFICDYISLAEAERITGISTNLIIACCKRRKLFTHNSFWYYDGNQSNIKDDVAKYRKRFPPVKQFDLCGNFIKEYSSEYEAGDAFGVDGLDIGCACLFGPRPINGFLFVYTGQEYKVEKWIKSDGNDDGDNDITPKKHIGRRKNRS